MTKEASAMEGRQVLTHGLKEPDAGLPPGWRRFPLGELALVVMGQSPSSKFYNTRGDGLPLIQGKADIENRKTISRVWTTEATKRCDAGDLILTVRAPVGSVGVASDQACIGRGVCALKPKLDGRFLFQAMVFAESDWRALEQGSTFTAANSDQVSRLFLVRFPVSRLEQAAVGKALSDVDFLIESLDQLIAKKRAIKNAARQQLVTGRVRLPGFSDSWRKTRIGEAFAIAIGTSKTPWISPGGRFFVVDMGSVSTDGRLLATKPTDYADDFLSAGDLVMPKDDIGGGKIIGKVALIPANDTYVLGDHIYALTAKEGNPQFLAYVINSTEVNKTFRSKAAGSAQLGLSRKAVAEQEISMPSPEEQEAIAEVLSDMDREIENLELRLKKTESMKQGMMQSLLSGAIRLVTPEVTA